MISHSFSREEAFRFGWDTFKKNHFFIMGFSLLLLVISMIPPILDTYFAKVLPSYWFVVKYLFFFWQIVLSMGMVKICLRYVARQEVLTSDIFSSFPLFFRYFLGSMIYGALVLLGLILLIVPGIIAAVKFQFYEYFIIDKGSGIKDAFQMSDRVTRGQMAELTVTGFFIVGMNLIGALFFGIGLLITFPLSKLVVTHIYRQLETPKESVLV